MILPTTRDVLFVFAHQDDECAAAPWIQEECATGNKVACVYLTNGQGHGVSSSVRNRESSAVLTSLGISSSYVGFLGTDLAIEDGELASRVPYMVSAVQEWLERLGHTPSVLYAPDWEGGHPDHDAAHLVAASIAVAKGLLDRAWGFSLYNAYRCPPPLFRVLSPLPYGEHRKIRYRLERGFRLAFLCWRYPSQRRTWLGLFPGFFLRRIMLRTETIRKFDLQRLNHRPHEGPLLYERMFSTPAGRLLEASSKTPRIH